ncbi:thiamine pyrophosphate-dependent dehydrogenase E1 component subunit alpha [Spongiibacter nanhainus]|uniref:Thiamine pyrophosphate-dependent dehydrogenase E1 component subunit alpha n=1 Tax=Spongiibacter nanhainus TaxID=2794344 RepID=A0A7T4UPU2_9GAMM|nr:thiamine pyrophosphate-dependent dehydrogenase E1 component subunit alpha [Spongiibacter nanhainus]QQD18021.1 thiamine pyrophosphate-dependent dehydrogenase E1 component subunit alpha [Spongiibacter nanhainus]
MESPSKDQLEWMYSKMVLAREYEEMMKRVYLEGKVPVFDMSAGPLPGEMHISSGQEPCAVGVAVHLSAADWMVASHRSHHQAIAKNVDLAAMTAEILGKESGLGGGRGGHMHLSDPKVRFTSTGIVGQALGIAGGHALASKMKGTSDVAVGCIGEGGANQGVFHEAMNLAALWKLPLICVIEDNRWGVSVAKDKSTSVSKNSDRAIAYGCYGEYVSGNDVWAVFEAAGRAVERARKGLGPTILEIETYRLEGHFVGDGEAYVPEDQKRDREDIDPINVMARRLVDEGTFSADYLESILATCKEQVDAVERYAREQADAKPSDALRHVFVEA